MLGMSGLVLGALAVWTLVALGIGLTVGRMIKLANDHQREDELQAELTRLKREARQAEREESAVSTAPPGRRGADTSQLPALGSGGYRVRSGLPPVPDPGLRLGPATLPPPPDLATGPMTVPPTQYVEVQEAAPPRRRVDDAPGQVLRPPQPGGRRRSDQRMTRSEARRIREGEDTDDG